MELVDFKWNSALPITSYKIEEVAALLGGHFQLLSLRDIGCTEELAEDFFILEENSRQKAEYVFKKFNALLCWWFWIEVGAIGGEPVAISAH